ncbi:Hint domain-containing protein [Acetobacter senegalensis]|uniref:Hint domain-containing protein n=1 Tax=Acetobacter senegalensis TaxID=446692 RepID=UPI001EDA3B33|nr:Hint domain-containing protein [Acetobacter senegalensis]MCG4255458.1 Hint domain-containing protein [Acetobacter senegalensis]
MSLLYGYNNTVTDSGSYTLVPTGWVLGLLSTGGASVTFTGDITDTLSFGASLISAVNPYIVTAEDGANVTVDVSSSVLGALTGSSFTANGGTITITGDNAISALSGNSYTIENGGTINLGTLSTSEISALGGSTITFGDGGGTLVITPASGVTLLTFSNISGFGNAGSTIEIPGAGEVINATYDSTSGTTSITTDTGVTVEVSGDYTASNNSLYQQESGGNLYISASSTNSLGTSAILVCFLSGSMIRTSKGDVAVEDIQIGDQVVTFDWRNNQDVIRPVIWTGKGHCKVRFDLPDDEAGWPVRVIKNAISDGVPYKDMLITAEHCLFFRDRFVPVRMLVNGVSIFYDKSITSYDYYHVETEQHSVITADGMLTESYLDTGNRSSFRQEGKIATLRGAVKNWADDAGAPLGVERSFVEPLFRTLEWRENSVVGTKISTTKIETTTDPDLHLITQTGAVIRPMRKTAHHYSFMLPPNTESVRIVSRSTRPSDVIGPFVDDRRYMGVAVADVQLQCAKQQFDITSHLQDEKPAGWHDTDWTDCAWTNGNAELPLGDHLTHGKMGILSMTIRAAGPYLLNTKPNSDIKKRSA